MIGQPSADTIHSELEKLAGEKCISIESYRKNGDPVATPVWFVIDRGSVLVRTGRKAGKVKGIQRNPRVRIAPCSFSGKPKGTGSTPLQLLERMKRSGCLRAPAWEIRSPVSFDPVSSEAFWWHR